MSKENDMAQEAVDVGTAVLQALNEYGTDPITAQAALGNAWFRLCKGLEYPATVFREMCDGMSKLYEKQNP